MKIKRLCLKRTDIKNPEDMILKTSFDELTVQEIKKEDGEDGDLIIAGVANKAVKDRVGDLIQPEAWDLSNFKKNPIIFFNHDRNFPIGKAIGYKVKEDGLHIKVMISKSKDPKVAYVRDMIKEGIVKAFSVGIKIDWDKSRYDEDQDVYVIGKCELLETSVVTVPANQESLFDVEETGKSIHVNDWGTKVDYDHAKEYVKKFENYEDKSKSEDSKPEENEERVEEKTEAPSVEESSSKPVESTEKLDESNQPYLANQQTMINQLGGMSESYAKMLEIMSRLLEVNEMMFSKMTGSGPSMPQQEEGEDDFEDLSAENVEQSDSSLLKYEQAKQEANQAFEDRIQKLQDEIKSLLG